MRDDDGKFMSTLEFSQEITELRNMEGEKHFAHSGAKQSTHMFQGFLSTRFYYNYYSIVFCNDLHFLDI